MSLVPETMPTKDIIEKSHERGDEKIEQGNLFQALLKRPMLCSFSLIVAIYFMIFNQVFFAIPIKLGELFAEDGAYSWRPYTKKSRSSGAMGYHRFIWIYSCLMYAIAS